MASWLQRQTPSHQAQIAGTALLSGLAVAGAILGIQALRRQSMVYDTPPSTVSFDTEYEKVCGSPRHMPLFISMLITPVKVHDTDTAASRFPSKKEDERAAILARRARHGDYDQGIQPTLGKEPTLAGTDKALSRAHSGTADSDRFISKARGLGRTSI